LHQHGKQNTIDNYYQVSFCRYMALFQVMYAYVYCVDLKLIEFQY